MPRICGLDAHGLHLRLGIEGDAILGQQVDEVFIGTDGCSSRSHRSFLPGAVYHCYRLRRRPKHRALRRKPRMLTPPNRPRAGLHVAGWPPFRRTSRTPDRPGRLWRTSCETQPSGSVLPFRLPIRPLLALVSLVLGIGLAACGGDPGGAATQAAAPLAWYTTCGDPVCRGYTPPAGVPRCTTETAGPPVAPTGSAAIR